jgi:hypothetical protein
MAVSNPSNTYGWILPVVGAAVGAWGGILNTIFGEDGVSGGIKGIDQVISEIQTDLTTAEEDIVALEADIVTLEGEGASAFFARSSMSGAQSIPKANATKVTWGVADFDNGGLITPDATLITIPAEGDGAYMIRASVQLAYTVGSGDDGRQIIISIRKGGVVVAQASVPYLNDGVDSSNSGDVTVAVAYLDGAAVAAEFYDVTVYQTFFDSGTGSANVKADTGSFFEAVRFAPEA